MTRARLTLAPGVTGPIKIPDMGFILRLGEVKWADEPATRESVCVAALIHAGKIRVSYEQKVLKPMSNPPPKPSVPSVTLSRPQRVATPSPSPATSQSTVDVDKLAQAVAAQIQVRPAVAPDAELLAALIEKAVTQALSRVTVATGTVQAAASASDEPVYIPSGIVGGDTVEIKTTAGVSDATDLADAAKALKAAGRPKRMRKQENGEDQ